MIGVQRACAVVGRRACAHARVSVVRTPAAVLPASRVSVAATSRVSAVCVRAIAAAHPSAGFARFCTDAKAEEAPAEPKQDAGDAAAGAGAAGEAAAAGEKTAEQRIAELEGEVKELQATRLRLLAEMENVRSIARNDVERAKKFAAKGFAKSLLSIADNLERAMQCVPEEARGEGGDKLLKDLYQGVQMTEDIMLKVFAQHGIHRFGQKGDEFDPHVHNALFQMPHDELEAGRVAEVLKTGFMYHDMVLRPAEVGTVKGE